MTAENEGWYLNGDPVAYAGNLYYPAGAQVFFNPNEMVRSGSHLGVPLYTRTTIEPFSVVYVPLRGGRMQPYERRRDRELTGTAGSSPSAMITTYDPGSAAGLLPQAAAPPALAPAFIADPEEPAERPEPSVARGSAGREPVGTIGGSRSARRAPHARIGGRPAGVNAVFVDLAGGRWYSTGRSVELDTARMQRTGEYKGFDVWRDRSASGTIYLAVTPGGTLLVPYSRNRADVPVLTAR